MTSISGRGIGMGALATTTEALGGRVEVTSARGKGTCVRFLLPHPAADTRSGDAAAAHG